MSSLPPNLVGSILQSHLAARQVSNAKDTKRAHDASASQQQTAAIDEQDSTVETDDSDTQVHTDAEGLGSQGRAFSEPENKDDQLEQTEVQYPDQEGRNIDLKA